MSTTEATHLAVLDEPLPPLSDAAADDLIDRLAGIDERIARINNQAAKMAREEEQAKEWILLVHGERLQDWARTHLKGKTRSVKRLVGTVGFRTVAARTTIEDRTQALEWAAEHLPAAIVETVDTKQIPILEVVDEGTGEVREEAPRGFLRHPARETFYVKGIRPAAGGDEEEAAA